MNYLRVIAVQLLILAFPLQGIAAPKADGILFKEVTTDKPCREAKGYVCGAEIYPDFSESGLPPNFGIKQVPGLVIPAIAITGAKIIKQQHGKWENWQLEIRFTKEYGRRLNKYTANKKGQLMAMEIGGRIAGIAPLASDLEDEMIITSTKGRIEAIGNLLRTIYPQITREIQTSLSNKPVHQDAAKPRW